MINDSIPLIPVTTENLLQLEKSMNQYWDHRSASYSDQTLNQLSRPQRFAWEDLIFRQINEQSKLKILDIGTGPGFFALIAALRGHKVTAVDMNPFMLSQARRNAEAYGVNIQFIRVENNLPFKDESFDLILSRDVTWTLTRPEDQLSHWASKLKTEGRMIYFDAEWNFYHRSEEERIIYEKNRAAVTKRGGFYYPECKKLEKIARKLPLTYTLRPQWDLDYWQGQNGFSVEIKRDLNSIVYNEVERMQYELFPEFVVTVYKV